MCQTGFLVNSNVCRHLEKATKFEKNLKLVLTFTNSISCKAGHAQIGGCAQPAGRVQKQAMPKGRPHQKAGHVKRQATPKGRAQATPKGKPRQEAGQAKRALQKGSVRMPVQKCAKG